MLSLRVASLKTRTGRVVRRFSAGDGRSSHHERLTCDGDLIRHFWSSELFYAPSDPGQEPRHVGTLEPLRNLLDLTPKGRPVGWAEQFSYV